jgi:hypothetical protein
MSLVFADVFFLIFNYKVGKTVYKYQVNITITAEGFKMFFI